MILDILTPEKSIFSGEIKLIKVPGTNGSFEVMENHAPIISSLDKGELKITPTDGADILYQIEGGVIEVNNNKAIVLIEKILK
ncbi:MAG: ATP synthase F1 subunit epsilon [Bacteroidales bacterium]|nr:ATP synthase F1 subunit epsilon [Bacteroidales bacterium]